MPRAGFELAISATKRSPTYASDLVATEIGIQSEVLTINYEHKWLLHRYSQFSPAAAAVTRGCRTLLLLQGGIAQGIPRTVTISDVLCVPI
jgi:hypothetical protein